MAHIVGLAQHPDGLPTGIGAQSQIENLIRDWFLAGNDHCPAVSQIRERAKTIIQSITKD